jgi:hypothetical protein
MHAAQDGYDERSSGINETSSDWEAWGAMAVLHPDEGWGAIMIIEADGFLGAVMYYTLVPHIRAAVMEASQN